jgi:hypothetical protein
LGWTDAAARGQPNPPPLARAEGKIRGYGKLVIAGIVEIGRELVGVKARLPGRYVEFVEDRLGWSKMHASRMVNVFEMFRGNKLLPATDGLTIDASSLYLIAAPWTPDEVTDLEPGVAPPNPIVIFIFFGQHQPEAY